MFVPFPTPGNTDESNVLKCILVTSRSTKSPLTEKDPAPSSPFSVQFG